ncbi:5'/3'-nucleotidase SurE [Neisseria chenwenguii]|uniref:5'-nucleotidase SurE n=1 Tax=Neisseria chenwenguii TaxID=1853278 RepID=A0A220S3R8_9NEIS|nr:5'/3'-nucleotidase SurE [Neisseria chenwenguii]ASK28056.1 5'/3'-nucleotidase SurE [Neisseria chenwenguii]ROV57206.1 5'/3'-nucleotidase SurE [Neisseria chenwenguii]
MNILICNDDGYLAQGIAVLARVAAEFANVRVVAPERDRSGVSNSLTLDRPLHIRQAENGFYYVNGTPTDCIHIGLHALPDFKPDLVLSGINNGANMGDDTLYSGTVAAATEAYLMGIPAVAVSLNDHSGRFWETAEKAAWLLLSHLLKNPPQKPVLWNINIPAVAPDDIQGIKITRLGRRHHTQSVVPMHNPRGEPIFWIGPVGAVSDREEGTDFGECEAGFITVTPLQIDLTAYDETEAVGAFWQKAV